MTTTTNYGMQLPAGTDPASITPINQNTTFLDTKLKELEDVTDSVIDEIDKTTSSTSGSIVTLTDEAPSTPLKSCVCDIEPVQASGTPSPDNPLAISGWSGITVTVADDYDNPTDSNTYTLTWTDAGIVYGGSIDLTSGVLRVTHKGVDLGTLSWKYITSTLNPIFTTDSLTDMIAGQYGQTPDIMADRYSVAVSDHRSMLGATMANGELSIISDYPSLAVRNDAYTSVSDFATAMSGAQIVYPLATPLTYQLTPQTIKTLSTSPTNLWADTGDTSITYVVKDEYSYSGIPTVSAVKQYIMDMLGI